MIETFLNFTIVGYFVLCLFVFAVNVHGCLQMSSFGLLSFFVYLSILFLLSSCTISFISGLLSSILMYYEEDDTHTHTLSLSLVITIF